MTQDASSGDSGGSEVSSQVSIWAPVRIPQLAGLSLGISIHKSKSGR